MNFYNEHDIFPATTIRQLIRNGRIPPGRVDGRSILDIAPGDLDGFTQCHFFAGIAGWSEALKIADWPDDRSIWSASCPCQPFSQAGLGGGTSDERHLWPVFFDLVRQCRPPVICGEQVEAAVEHGWLDGIQSDLEGEGYAFWAVVLGAHSVGAPHRRQRIYWCALAQPDDAGLEGHLRNKPERGEPGRVSPGEAGSGVFNRILRELGHSNSGRLNECDSVQREVSKPDAAGSFWAESRLIECYDGKLRPVPRDGSGISALAHGVPKGLDGINAQLPGLGIRPAGCGAVVRSAKSVLANASKYRVGALKAAGNAIVPQVAAEFIRAFMPDALK